MHLHIAGNIDITPAIRSYTEEKMSHLLKRDDRVSNMHVTLHVEHVTHVAEGTMHLDGVEFHASAKEDDMYKAIDAMVEKLLTQLAKHKDKMIDSHH